MPEDKIHSTQKLAGLVYLLYLLGILFGITALIGVIVNHTHLSETRGTYVHSHFIWQICSFWILFVCAAVAVFLLPAKTMIYAAMLWWLCSALIGIWLLRQKQPVPFLKTLQPSRH